MNNRLNNKLLIPLMTAISLCLIFSSIFIYKKSGCNSPQNSSVVSKEADSSQYTTQKTYAVNENNTDPCDKSDSTISKYKSVHLEPLLDTPRNKENVTTNTNNTNTVPSNNIEHNTKDKQIITIPQFLSSLKCVSYSLKPGETLTQIARKYENTCNLNTTIKLTKSINKITNADNLDNGISLLIPENTIKNGTMYHIVKGDTWYSIINKYYNNYDVVSMTKVLVYINDLPNNDLPLGESIFLPSI